MTFIQHVDRNIGPANYRHLSKDEMLITSIFYTFQGEGPNAGVPAVFIRLAGCNRGAKEGMGCEFCDTAFQYRLGERVTFADIGTKVGALGHELFLKSAGEFPIVVITGGEPMMQDNLVGLLEHLQKRGFMSVQIESNGDRLVPGFNSDLATLVISPKVTKGLYRRPNEDALEFADCLKFIVSASIVSPYHSVPDWANNYTTCLSPMTIYRREHSPKQPVSAWDPSLIDHAATKENYAYAAKLALKRGFFLTMQQQLFFNVE